VFRHLDIPRNDELIENLEKFVRKVVGCKYKVSPSILLKKKNLDDIN
jgi:hypothetical protein